MAMQGPDAHARHCAVPAAARARLRLARLCDGKPAGCCVVCYAVSTSMGKVVAKLDDVFVAADYRGKGVGTRMLKALKVELK